MVLRKSVYFFLLCFSFWSYSLESIYYLSENQELYQLFFLTVVVLVVVVLVVVKDIIKRLIIIRIIIDNDNNNNPYEKIEVISQSQLFYKSCSFEEMLVFKLNLDLTQFALGMICTSSRCFPPVPFITTFFLQTYSCALTTDLILCCKNIPNVRLRTITKNSLKYQHFATSNTQQITPTTHVFLLVIVRNYCFIFM